MFGENFELYHSVLPPSLLGGPDFPKTATWGGMVNYALVEGEVTFLGDRFAWGRTQLFVQINIFLYKSTYHICNFQKFLQPWWKNLNAILAI